MMYGVTADKLIVILSFFSDTACDTVLHKVAGGRELF